MDRQRSTQDAHRLPAPHSRWHQATHLLHHFLAATMLASLMWVLETGGALQWLDGMMLRLAGTPSKIFQHDDAALAGLRPTIVEIDSAAYATVFGERSPLDRMALALLLDRIPRETTQVLAIDLDLSMSFPERQTGAPRRLDADLAALVAHGVQVVLVLPDLLRTTDNLPWIRSRCADGIHFARSELDERMGAVTRIDPENPTLAVVAVELHRAADLSASFSDGEREAAHDSLSVVVCQAAAAASDDQDLQHRIDDALATRNASHRGEPSPLNPFTTTYSFLEPAVSVVTGSASQPGLDGAFRSNPIVLVGGSYDARDALRTASGVLPGLHVHAASIASLQSSPADAHQFLVFVLDVVVGVGLGYLFAFFWSAYGRFETACQRQSGWWWLVGFYLSSLLLATLWTIPIVLAAIAFVFAKELLQAGWWLNPGPIIIGMFLHSMSIRREAIVKNQAGRVGANEVKHRGGAFQALKAFAMDHPASLFLHFPCTLVFLILARHH